MFRAKLQKEGWKQRWLRGKLHLF